MKAFWNDRGEGTPAELAKEVNLQDAGSIWSDQVPGIKGNFFGLIDDEGNTIQFYFESGIPDDVDDASHLSIVLMDFPQFEIMGSYTRLVTVGEVQGLIRKAFQVGAFYRKFAGVEFSPW